MCFYQPQFWLIFWQRKQKIKVLCFVSTLTQWTLSKSGLRMNSAAPTGRYCICLIRRWKKADEHPSPKKHHPTSKDPSLIKKKTGINLFFFILFEWTIKLANTYGFYYQKSNPVSAIVVFIIKTQTGNPEATNRYLFLTTIIKLLKKSE